MSQASRPPQPVVVSELRAGDILARSGANGDRLLFHVCEIEPDAELVLALDPTTGETEWLMDLDGFELLALKRGSEDGGGSTSTLLLPSPPSSSAPGLTGAAPTTWSSPSPSSAGPGHQSAGAAPPRAAAVIRIPGFATEIRVLTAAADGADIVQRGDVVAAHATAFAVAPDGTGALRKCWSTHDWQPGQPRGPFEYTAGTGAVVKGFEIGLIGAGVGEVRELRIPASEAYGAAGCSAWGIPRDADLQFEIEVRACVNA